MIYAGLDVGTRTAKAVVLGPDGILGSDIAPVNDAIDKVGQRTLKSALKLAGISKRKLAGIAVTGYGRRAVKSMRLEFPDTMCLARAVHHLCPEVDLVLDVGGLTTRVVRIGEKGTVQDYLENEKCASGSGRFLEMVAEALEVPLEQIGGMSLTSGKPLTLTTQCVVFAESEVVNHVNAGEEPADILAGLHRSIAEQINTLVRRIGLTPNIAAAGGVAKNEGVMHFLERELNLKLHPLPEDPQLIGAYGAALLARDG